jgi:hypothetical protein
VIYSYKKTCFRQFLCPKHVKFYYKNEINLSEGPVNTFYPELYSKLNGNYCQYTCRVGG